jgi:hypothetical protein
MYEQARGMGGGVGLPLTAVRNLWDDAGGNAVWSGQVCAPPNLENQILITAHLPIRQRLNGVARYAF